MAGSYAANDMMASPMRLPMVVWTLLVVAACGPGAGTSVDKDKPAARSFAVSKILNFTDTYPATMVADNATLLYVGSTRGLVRWDLTTGKHAVLTTKEGLPDNRIAAVAVDTSAVWVATAKGVVRLAGRGVEKAPAAPVGEFLTGLKPSGDGRTVWAGGPEGLARLRTGVWERYLPDLGITSLTTGDGGVVWVGTSGKGVLRVPPAGDHFDIYGAQQGLEIDNVRGIARLGKDVVVVGDGPGGPRLALYDPGLDRFFSYTVELDKKTISPTWAARGGADTYIAVDKVLYRLAVAAPEAPPVESRLRVQARPTTPTPPPRKVAPAAELPTSALDGAAATTLPPSPKKMPPPPAPRLDAVEASFALPDGVTSVGSSDRGLLLGTRFLGATRVENGVVRTFRVTDLAAGAERLTLACSGENCYLATGGPRAWRFDGQSFQEAKVDPEPGSRVLAMILDPHGQVLAIHRGAKDADLRISTVAGKTWSPVTIQPISVPFGHPELNFAVFAPTGKLWVGLRYLDADNDLVDFGVAEIGLDGGEVRYHRQGLMDEKALVVPNDTVAMYWKSAAEAWFATRSGAAHLSGGKVRVFTENEGMESELIRDIGPGPSNEIWVATGKGTGKYDGARWTFPRMGPFYLKATSLGHDEKGHVFIGGEKGLFCVGDCEPDPIDSRRGLLDNAVIDLNVDSRGRVWVLTPKGISIVEP
jgi:hypothetical protein